jgi:hypothetical protein
MNFFAAATFFIVKLESRTYSSPPPPPFSSSLISLSEVLLSVNEREYGVVRNSNSPVYNDFFYRSTVYNDVYLYINIYKSNMSDSFDVFSLSLEI